MGNGVAFFEIASDDPEALERFYGDVFGWTFTAGHGNPYSIIQTQAEGLPLGGLWDSKAEKGHPLPANYAICVIKVDDVAETCEQVVKAGGEVMVAAMPSDDGAAVFAHLRDPSGNHIAIFHQVFTYEKGELL